MTTDMRCLTNVMTEELRSLSAAEIDAVSGGLQYNNNDQNYVMKPPPAAAPAPNPNGYYDMSSPYI